MTGKHKRIFDLVYMAIIFSAGIIFLIIRSKEIKEKKDEPEIPIGYEEYETVEYDPESMGAVKVGDHILFGSYEQDNNTENGAEKIEWIVLDKQEDKMLVLSRFVLDCQPFHTSYTSVTWETCSLRSWLKYDFYLAAFTEEEGDMILTTPVVVDKAKYPQNSQEVENPPESIDDKLFLLSETEANNYFISKEDRICYGTEYCFAQGIYKDSKGVCRWLLRSPGSYYNTVIHVDYNGFVNYLGEIVSRKNENGVRPAMWLKLEP